MPDGSLESVQEGNLTATPWVVCDCSNAAVFKGNPSVGAAVIRRAPKAVVLQGQKIPPAISSTPQACGVASLHPRQRRVRHSPCCVWAGDRIAAGPATATLARRHESALAMRRQHPTGRGWWVTFGEQSRVISRECRRCGPSQFGYGPGKYGQMRTIHRRVRRSPEFVCARSLKAPRRYAVRDRRPHVSPDF
jgi:hypothetical protein